MKPKNRIRKKRAFMVCLLSAVLCLSSGLPSRAEAERQQKDEISEYGTYRVGERETGQVDLLTGRLCLEQTDLPGGKESPVEFVRYYVSGSTYSEDEDNPAGAGMYWTHNYCYSASVYEGDIVIQLPGELSQNWQKVYAEGWISTNAPSYTLEEQGDGYLLTGPDGEKVLFDSAGNRILYSHDEDENLISAFVEDGWSLQYFYDDSVTDGERLVSVTNEEGREILSAEYELISDMSVSYGQSVVYLETETQPACTFSYEHYNGIHTCTYADGSTLAVTFDQNTTQPEYYLWSWYDSQGAVMRRMQTSAQKY
ncbi:MAG: DUF6531 domain-containing protein [Candidatus Merdisoma sp.]